MKVYSIVPLLAAPVLFFVCGCRMFDEKIQPPGFAQLGLTESAEDNCLFRHSSGGTLKLVPRKRHCFINGRMFYLPHAVTQDDNGKCRVSDLGIEKVIAPLFTGASFPRRIIRTVILDPGHGGDNSGAVGVKYKEKDLNLALAREIANALQKRGFQVRFTRNDDRFLTLDERGSFARRENGDLFLSIHHNASPGKYANGVETYIATPCGSASSNDPETQVHETAAAGNRFDRENLHLAAVLQEKICLKTARKDRGVRFARFRVLVLSDLPAALIEAGYVSNTREELQCARPEEQRKIAEGIAEAIVQFNSTAL